MLWTFLLMRLKLWGVLSSVFPNHPQRNIWSDKTSMDVAQRTSFILGYPHSRFQRSRASAPGLLWSQPATCLYDSIRSRCRCRSSWSIVAVITVGFPSTSIHSGCWTRWGGSRSLDVHWDSFKTRLLSWNWSDFFQKRSQWRSGNFQS